MNSTVISSDPRTQIILSRSATVLWYLGLPLYYLAVPVLFVLRQLYRPLAFLLLPVIYLARFILACIIAPFQFLARFETLYIYLGVAALTGISIGLLVSYAYGALQAVLGLESDPKQPTRTAKEYRETKRKQQIKAEAPLMSSGVLSPRPQSPDHLLSSDGLRNGRRSRGLLNQTIMEEIDSDF